MRPPQSAAAEQKARPQPKLVRVESGSVPYREQREIQRRLSRLGVPAERAMVAFAVLRGLVVILSAALGLLLGHAMPVLAGKPAVLLLIAVAFGVGGWLLPGFVIRMLVNNHAKAVATGLPDALELLVICVEAGLSLEDGLDRIVTELKLARPALAEELTLTSADLKILPSRDQALFNMAAAWICRAFARWS